MADRRLRRLWEPFPGPCRIGSASSIVGHWGYLIRWPCFTARDVGQNCDIQRIRGHGLVRKGSKVSRVEIGLVRLGRYPAGTLVENETNKNSGTLPQIEQTTAWLPVASESCATTFRAWTRTSFAVRWTDGRLSKLSLLGDPTTSQVCRRTAAMTPAQRQQLRAQLQA